MGRQLGDITNTACGRPARVPASLVSGMRGAVKELARLSGSEALSRIDGADLLTERAELSGRKAQGTVSAGASCRLLQCTDAWLAVNLARNQDWQSIDAWLETDGPWDWPRLADELATRETARLLERAELLGMAVAGVTGFQEGPRTLPPAIPATLPARPGRPSVIDLSSLWAGPLAARLLGLGGARVTKVESRARPDGARFGNQRFYRRLNDGKREVSLDLDVPEGRKQLLELLEQADMVIESSRARALEQLGIDVDGLVASRPGLTWVSITGYGRRGDGANRVAFGDDAAAAAGLCSLMGKLNNSGPIFCGDAIADPITGAQAAVAAWSVWAGDGGLVELSLRDTTVQLIG